MSENKTVKGYKVFNPDWTCRGFQYKVGECYEMDEKPKICERGYHFCKDLKDCYDYYSFNSDNKVAEITAYGDIDVEENRKKSCTNKIKIEKEIVWNEVLNTVNTGKGCTGLGNSGDYNSGNHNSGDYNTGGCNYGDSNSGGCNSGNYNSGDYNSGNHNSGYSNSGDYNSGNYNSGDYNTGNWNAGDWNVTNYSSGCFNTVEPKIPLFNKMSDWTMKDWARSKAKDILDNMDVSPVQKIYEGDMTDREKEEHPEYQTTGFYLKKLSQKEIAEKRQQCWDRLSQEEKEIVMAIPNFDKAIFKETTGIDVDRKE